MEEAPEQAGDLRSLKLLKGLVTVLMVVMIVGFIVLIAVLVTNFPGTRSGGGPALPDSIALPEGAVAEAFTQGDGWYAVVTEDQRILIFDAASGDLRQDVEILPAE
ncbi:DUF6476 family protein [Pseudoruegeria sp. HB172150]|uniref:DUF6476 family protein n=1 Tax=Pseudoruegeria sp. HB172150 TaxID=2721164 RepID=UPI001556FD70|nr:DUF6476 family protein [Pseudoruegeria sp. HB172150]